MSEEIIELSIAETNALRAELGLKPLQINGRNEASSDGTTKTAKTSEATGAALENVDDGSEEISLSIEESNALRKKLGLKCLTANGKQEASGRKSSEAIHAPPKDTAQEDLITERIAKAKLKREVDAGIAKFKSESSTGGKRDLDALGWADRMRARKETPTSSDKESKKKKKLKVSSYTDEDFENQNLLVAHNTADFDAGTTTVLTLADKSILDVGEDGDNVNALENVNMSESANVKDNLKRKRMVELGLGHAGGYAGYDDDEFEELNGSQMTLGGVSKSKASGRDDSGKKYSGFKLGGAIKDANGKEAENDLFAAMSGKSISLVAATGDGATHQTDFMSYEEEEALGINALNKEDIEKRRKKKEKKMLKKLRKDKKKKNCRDKKEDGAEVGGKDQDQDQPKVNSGLQQGSSLLDELVASSQKEPQKPKRRKRRREVDSDDSDAETASASIMKNNFHGQNGKEADTKKEDEDKTTQQKKKDKFHLIMEKGNKRTQAVFQPNSESKGNEADKNDELEEIEDDAFLSAALSKARRLNRLRELNAKPNGSGSGVLSKKKALKGANAVIESLHCMNKPGNGADSKSGRSERGKITFELGTTTEFTRALRAQPAKPIVVFGKKKSGQKLAASSMLAKGQSAGKVEVEDVSMEEMVEDESAANNETLAELADQVEEEPDTMGAFGSTGTAAGVGRGISAFLGMLKQTGEISGKTSGREELRGRAKDEKTYDDYAPLNLKEVVKLDTTGLRNMPHEKDVELANREIKLEYRDDHGRLLTRKEAFRQLCYQFHGHGSSKKNEEKRLQQIEREQHEKSANNGTAGTLGALKATQKATGKAFILHKT